MIQTSLIMRAKIRTCHSVKRKWIRRNAKQRMISVCRTDQPWESIYRWPTKSRLIKSNSESVRGRQGRVKVVVREVHREFQSPTLCLAEDWTDSLLPTEVLNFHPTCERYRSSESMFQCKSLHRKSGLWVSLDTCINLFGPRRMDKIKSLWLKTWASDWNLVSPLRFKYAKRPSPSAGLWPSETRVTSEQQGKQGEEEGGEEIQGKEGKAGGEGKRRR